jgi:predicted acetyltransferase
MKYQDSEYRIMKGTAGNDELEKYRLCFEKNGTKRDISNIQWTHQKNPLGINAIYYAIHQNDIAAIYAAMPVVFNINSKEMPVLQSIDTITDLDHRGKGLFPKLATKLYDDAASNGFAFVYGFPNQNSASGFYNKLQWKSFGEAPFLIKPLRISFFIKKFINKKKRKKILVIPFTYLIILEV